MCIGHVAPHVNSDLPAKAHVPSPRWLFVRAVLTERRPDGPYHVLATNYPQTILQEGFLAYLSRFKSTLQGIER